MGNPAHVSIPTGNQPQNGLFYRGYFGGLTVHDRFAEVSIVESLGRGQNFKIFKRKGESEFNDHNLAVIAFCKALELGADVTAHVGLGSTGGLFLNAVSKSNA